MRYKPLADPWLPTRNNIQPGRQRLRSFENMQTKHGEGTLCTRRGRIKRVFRAWRIGRSLNISRKTSFNKRLSLTKTFLLKLPRINNLRHRSHLNRCRTFQPMCQMKCIWFLSVVCNLYCAMKKWFQLRKVLKRLQQVHNDRTSHSSLKKMRNFNSNFTFQVQGKL